MRFATIRRTVVVGIVGVVILGGSMMVGAAGPGRFLVTLIGGGAQQGGVTVTGACQDGAPLTMSVYHDYQAGEFVIHEIAIGGIDAACLDGTLVLNGGPDGIGFDPHVPAPGAALVELEAPVPVGELGSISVLLTE